MIPKSKLIFMYKATRVHSERSREGHVVCCYCLQRFDERSVVYTAGTGE